MPDLSIILPAYNEKERINKTLENIKAYLAKQKYSFEVLIVDDGSVDNSKLKITEFVNNWNHFQVIGYQKNKGKGGAVKYGVEHSNGRYILFMDADGSTNIAEFEKFRKYLKKYPIIIGSRYLKKGSIKIKQPFYRKAIARSSNLIIRSILWLPFKDTQCGFKLFRRDVALKIFPKMTLSRWGFDFELLAIAKKYRLKTKEITVDWYDDPNSRVKSSAIFKTFLDLFKVRWNLWNNKYK